MIDVRGRERGGVVRALFICLVGVVVIGLVVALVVMYRSTTGLREELDAIRAAGEPVTFADLDRSRPPIDGADDAAPLYREAMELFEASGDGSECVALLQELENEPDDAVWERLRNLVERNAPVFALLDEAALRPECRLDLQVRLGAQTSLDGIQRVRPMSNVALLRVREAIERGDGDDAVDAWFSYAALPRMLDYEPVLIYHMLATAFRGVAASLATDLLTAQPSDAQLARVERVLMGLEDPEGLYRSFLAERAFGIGLWRKVLPVEYEDELLDTPEMPEQLPGSMLFVRYHALGYLRDFRAMVAVARKPWPEIFTASRTIEGTSTFGRMIVVGLAHMVASHGTVLTRIRTARVAIQIERYRRQHERLPASLEELETWASDWNLPSDPFTGKALQLQSDDEGFVVYGVGANGVDDGGVLDENNDSGLRVVLPR